MRIDIILRTKNRPEFLGRAIDSVLAQTHDDWTLVLINDGGDSKRVDTVVTPRLHTLRDRLLRIDNVISRNMAAAFNQAMTVGSAPLVACHDDDDSWHPGFLERSQTVLEGFSHFPVAGTACSTVLIEEEMTDDGIKELKRHWFSGKPKGLMSLPEVLLNNESVTTNALVLRREVLEELRGYDETLPVLQDWELLVRLLCQHDILTFEDELAYYHVRRIREDDAAANSDAQVGHRAFIEWLYNRWTRQGISGKNPVLGQAAATARMLRRVLEHQDQSHDHHRDAILRNSCSIRTWTNRFRRMWTKG